MLLTVISGDPVRFDANDEVPVTFPIRFPLKPDDAEIDPLTLIFCGNLALSKVPEETLLALICVIPIPDP